MRGGGMIRLEVLANSNEHVHELVELFNCVWGGMTAELWKWKHLQNPLLDVAPTIVAWDNDNIVGANCFMPAIYLIQGIPCKVVQSCDSMIHPNYRGQGIFTKILCAAEEYYSSYGYKFMIGFPNEKSFPGLMKAGWEHLCDLNQSVLFQNSFPVLKKRLPDILAKFLSIPIDKYHVIKSKRSDHSFSDFNVKILDECPQSLIDISRKRDLDIYHMQLSQNYLKWRLDSKVETEYRYIIVDDDVVPIAYSIVSLPSLSSNYKISRIIDFDLYQENIRVMGFLLATSVEYLTQYSDAIHVPLYTGSKSFKRVLRNHGFISFNMLPNIFKIPLMVKLLHESFGREINKQSKWKINFIDADTA